MELTYGKALQQAIEEEMSLDKKIVLFGEDIQKNLYGYTEGLAEKFGEERVINIPLSEAGVVGLACGASMCGLRPIVDLTIPNFLYVAMDQIASIAAKTYYMYNGKYSMPITLFCSSMQGSGNAAQHSDRLHSMFMSIPGLKIICPATPQDMYSMMRGAIRDDNPVLCFADRSLFWKREEVDLSKIIRPGVSNKVKSGDDLTIITVSSCLQLVRDILPEIESLGINPEIIDVRSIVPLDYSLISESVKKTGRVIICDTANKSGSAASEIASYIQENLFKCLKGPIKIVACENVPIPFAKKLEQEILVTKDKILSKIKEV